MRFADNHPIYIQIADYFYNQILRKKIVPGDKIPSVRETAIEMEVNPNTVMRSFQHLQENEIILNKRGIGYFLTDDALEKVKSIKREEFIQTKLPEFVSSMEELSLDFEDVETLYKKYYSG